MGSRKIYLLAAHRILIWHNYRKEPNVTFFYFYRY